MARSVRLGRGWSAPRLVAERGAGGGRERRRRPGGRAISSTKPTIPRTTAAALPASDQVIQLVRAQVDRPQVQPADQGADRAQAQARAPRRRRRPARRVDRIKRGRQQRQRRRDQDDDRRGRRQIHEHETAEERAGDRADRPPEIDVADRAAGLPRLLDGHLGDDRPDHAQHRRRHQEVEHDHEHGPQLPVDLVGAGDDQSHLGVDPERAKRQQRPQREQRPDGPAGLDPVGQAAPQHVPQADPGQDDPDHARPDRERLPHVPSHQPARNQLQDHDAKATGKRQSIRQQPRGKT